MIVKTGFEFGFDDKIEVMEIGKIKNKFFPYHTIGVSNEAFISKWFGLKKDSFRLMFYDFDGKVLSEREWEKILEAFTNDILLFESTKGLHFISLCEDLDTEKTPEYKASELSKELNQDYYSNIYVDSLTLRVIPKKNFRNEIHKKAPKFLRLIRKPKTNTKLSFEHLRIYYKLGLPKEVAKIYMKRCKICKYKTNYYFYRCGQ